MKTVQLLQLTDTHLFGDATAELYDVNTAQSLQAVLDDALGGRRGAPDAIVVTGDIAEDESAKAYAGFRKALSTARVPVYCLPGNHDAPDLMAAALDTRGFQYCGAAQLGAWQLVMLNSHVPRDPAGYVARAEFERLERCISERPEANVLVGVHHPPARVGSRWLDAVGLRNQADLLAVAARHPRVRGVIAGHVHQPHDVQVGHVRILTTPSTCAQFMPDSEHCAMDQRPPGYRWLRLLPDGGIETEVFWLEQWRPAKPVRDTRAIKR